MLTSTDFIANTFSNLIYYIFIQPPLTHNCLYFILNNNSTTNYHQIFACEINIYSRSRVHVEHYILNFISTPSANCDQLRPTTPRRDLQRIYAQSQDLVLKPTWLHLALKCT